MFPEGLSIGQAPRITLEETIVSYSSKVTIHKGLFEVISYGNGAAYSFGLAEDEEDARVFVQGDDATAFREEWTSVENACPHLATDIIIRDIYINWSAEA